jgi:Protein of unknown function (DUF1688)
MRTTRPSPLMSLSALKQPMTSFDGVAQPHPEPKLGESAAVRALQTTDAVRQRAAALLARARGGQSEYFEVRDIRMAPLARFVADVTERRYPGLQIPFHSRWRHFEAGGVARKALLDKALVGQHTADRVRSYIDLAVVSVLLDAGAGADWRYQEASTGQSFARSEGLGVASFHAFMAGMFSSDKAHPLRVDAAGLVQIDEQQLARAFQVTPENPLVGLAGRAALLQRLGTALTEHPHIFAPPMQPGDTSRTRPGMLYDHLAYQITEVQAHDILSTLLRSLSGIWLADNHLDNEPLGDCWPCPALRAVGFDDGWMPFHKLSQWLTYSLIEPFEWVGVKVRGLDQLTALPEYRNGGLLLDDGLLTLKNPSLAQQIYTPGDPLVVEWRALTVALIDELAPRVRSLLNLSEDQLPLAALLEGGTWAAGRELAQSLRGGLPPLQIQSDGTVF